MYISKTTQFTQYPSLTYYKGLTERRKNYNGEEKEGENIMNKGIMENGKPVKCPKCGSTNVEAVQNFDYIKQCNDCGREFMSNEHN